jgi:hypothetical protein
MSRLAELRMSLLPGLNATPRTATRWPANEPPDQLHGQIYRARPVAHVDDIYLGEQRGQGADAQLLRDRGEGANVLVKASAAVAEAGGEEAPADSLIIRQRRGQRCHVGAGRLADLGQHVDERQPGGQERVRGHLD